MERILYHYEQLNRFEGTPLSMANNIEKALGNMGIKYERKDMGFRFMLDYRFLFSGSEMTSFIPFKVEVKDRYHVKIYGMFPVNPFSQNLSPELTDTISRFIEETGKEVSFGYFSWLPEGGIGYHFDISLRNTIFLQRELEEGIQEIYQKLARYTEAVFSVFFKNSGIDDLNFESDDEEGHKYSPVKVSFRGFDEIGLWIDEFCLKSLDNELSFEGQIGGRPAFSEPGQGICLQVQVKDHGAVLKSAVYSLGNMNGEGFSFTMEKSRSMENDSVTYEVIASVGNQDALSEECDSVQAAEEKIQMKASAEEVTENTSADSQMPQNTGSASSAEKSKNDETESVKKSKDKKNKDNSDSDEKTAVEEQPAKETEVIAEEFDSMQIEVGETLMFGTFKQQENAEDTDSSIEWVVLAKEGDAALIISKYALECQPYNTDPSMVTWETCSLRSWLNESFLKEAFDENQISHIKTSHIEAEVNPEYITNPGSDTEDKVFILGISEARKYFDSDEARQCRPTDYARTRGVYVNNDNGNCWWWLRTPGYSSTHAADVYRGGLVDHYGNYVNCDKCGVRPAMWIKL